MSKKEINNLPHGLCIIFWDHRDGGGYSLASIGSQSDGKRWFAPTNWISGSALMEDHHKSINKVEYIAKK